MITGEFDAQGQPFVRCDIVIPRLGLSSQIRFLVDTGAYKTCVHPWDAVRMSIPFDLLQDRQDSIGIGGSSSYFNEYAYLVFQDGQLTRLYEVELLIAEPGTRVDARLPSLLGRDLLYFWDMVYAPMSGRLEFQVRYADNTFQKM